MNLNATGHCGNHQQQEGTNAAIAPAKVRGYASVVVSKWAVLLEGSDMILGYGMAAWKFVKYAFSSPLPKQNRRMAPVGLAVIPLPSMAGSTPRGGRAGNFEKANGFGGGARRR